ncbi:hypothetical protein EVAR_7695_1 [Eumeta japonica]|uniref:Uncharacterized protein n=1 Tax=Eumeta variegata TaxID=151549 RepID=A0A4C1TJH5_EUMVA|nr:hypothetical protein EVAR_7695_1 [Eumeta japonica]
MPRGNYAGVLFRRRATPAPPRAVSPASINKSLLITPNGAAAARATPKKIIVQDDISSRRIFAAKIKHENNFSLTPPEFCEQNKLFLIKVEGSSRFLVRYRPAKLFHRYLPFARSFWPSSEFANDETVSAQLESKGKGVEIKLAITSGSPARGGATGVRARARRRRSPGRTATRLERYR